MEKNTFSQVNVFDLGSIAQITNKPMRQRTLVRGTDVNCCGGVNASVQKLPSKRVCKKKKFV